jgi:hypothetical protein
MVSVLYAVPGPFEVDRPALPSLRTSQLFRFLRNAGFAIPGNAKACQLKWSAWRLGFGVQLFRSEAEPARGILLLIN